MPTDGNCIDDCKKYLGLPPYNSGCNIVQGDGHFYTSLCDKYGVQNVKNTIQHLRGEKQ